jgi:hypothetical protein
MQTVLSSFHEWISFSWIWMFHFYFRFHEQWIFDLLLFSFCGWRRGFRLVQMGLGVGSWIGWAFISMDGNRCVIFYHINFLLFCFRGSRRGFRLVRAPCGFMDSMSFYFHVRESMCRMIFLWHVGMFVVVWSNYLELGSLIRTYASSIPLFPIFYGNLH